jgi:hypothetical protein
MYILFIWKLDHYLFIFICLSIFISFLSNQISCAADRAFGLAWVFSSLPKTSGRWRFQRLVLERKGAINFHHSIHRTTHLKPENRAKE